MNTDQEGLAAIFFDMAKAGVHYLLDAVELFILGLESGLDEASDVLEATVHIGSQF